MSILIWIALVFVVSCGITGVGFVVDDIVTNWSHARMIIETDPVPDYWEIARLERELFKSTYHMPESSSYCRCDECVKKAGIAPPARRVSPPPEAPTAPSPNPYADWSIEDIHNQAYRPPPPEALIDPNWVDEDGKPW